MAKETTMSVMEQIRKLDEEKAKLLNQAKEDALRRAEEAVQELRELGFNYRLVETDSEPTRTRSTSTGGRRTGVRDDIMKVIRAHPDGIRRGEILNAMGVGDDKSFEGSVSNALANMKKAGTITLDNGLYRAA